MNKIISVKVFASLLLLAGCDASPENEAVSEAAGTDASPQFSNWEHHGRSHSEQRFSPLTEITSENAGQIGLAWSQDIPGARTLVATPLAVDGLLYYPTDFGLEVYAVDGATGEVVWRHQAQFDDPAAMRKSMGVMRGVAHEDGRIFAAMAEGQLNALDAKTGALLWSVQTFPKEGPRVITGAPRVFSGKVIIGHGGGDVGARGYVSTYDAATGELLWRFYIVPGNPADGFEDKAMEMAAKTWSGEWWRYGGGGTAWNAMTYDPEFNHVYIGTGNSTPYNPQIRSPGIAESGDNLFLCSIVALDADTGEYLWHYQINPREAWDYKATMDMVLANLEINGEERKVLMQAPTNGFFYIIDRETGELLSAEKWGGKVNWAERIDIETGRPVERPNIRFEEGELIDMWPGPIGAHNYQPMSFSPDTGLVYLPHQELGVVLGLASPEEYAANPTPAHLKYVYQTPGITFARNLFDGEHGGKGSLVAWDPVTQSERWRVVTDSFWNSGTLATAGNLVFYGTAKGKFSAYNATTGDEVWSVNAGLGIISSPISYAIGETQYISILVGYGGFAGTGRPFLQEGWKYGKHPRRLLTFRLNGDRVMPDMPPPDFSVNPVLMEGFDPDPAKADHGAMVYGLTCRLCHGGGLNAISVGPDLRESHIAANHEALRSLLHDGTLVSRGMPLFDDLTDEDVEGIYHYIRAGAEALNSEVK